MPDGDEAGTFGPSTRAAVEAFQRHRGLRIDGIVGTLTWERLVEAGFKLGDRPLAPRVPWLRGDDVAELQERLAALGFNPGRVDGIFGPQTASAVTGFQRDTGLAPDGIAAGATTAELLRLAVRHPRSTLVNEVHERNAARHATLDSMIIALGHAGGLESLVTATARELRSRGAQPRVLTDRDEGPLAAAANAAGATCLVVVRLDAGASAATALYFASERSESPAGHQLADALSAGAARALGVPGATRGMTLTVLRESAMPAAVLEVGPLDALVERAGDLAAGIALGLERWADPKGTT